MVLIPKVGPICFLHIRTCPASFLPHAHTTPSVSMATMNSDPQARCTTFLSLMRVTITGHFYNMRNTDDPVVSTVMAISRAFLSVKVTFAHNVRLCRIRVR